MQTSVLQFGTEVPGQAYVLRPGSYAVIHNGVGRIAVVLTPLGASLPGGGQEPGESVEATVVRETMEECGLSIRGLNLIGVADELILGDEGRTYYRKRCTFFTAEAQSGVATQGTEADHHLVWLPVRDALRQLFHQSQKWAVEVSHGAAHHGRTQNAEGRMQNAE